MTDTAPPRTPHPERWSWVSAAEPPDVELVAYVLDRLNEWNPR